MFLHRLRRYGEAGRLATEGLASYARGVPSGDRDGADDIEAIQAVVAGPVGFSSATRPGEIRTGIPAVVRPTTLPAT